MTKGIAGLYPPLRANLLTCSNNFSGTHFVSWGIYLELLSALVPCYIISLSRWLDNLLNIALRFHNGAIGLSDELGNATKIITKVKYCMVTASRDEPCTNWRHPFRRRSQVQVLSPLLLTRFINLVICF